METQRLIEELYENTCKVIVKDNNILLGIKNFVNFSVSISTSYYKDIISCKVAYDNLLKSKKLGIISDSESQYLEDFFSRYIIKIFSNVVEEQTNKEKESLSEILTELESLKKLLIQAKGKEVKKGFMKLLADNHIYNENEYYFHLGKKHTENLESKSNQISINEVNLGIYEVIKKISLEKKILHNKIIIKSLSQFQFLQEIFDDILANEITESLHKLQTKSKLILNYCKKHDIELFNSRGGTINIEYFWQKIVSYTFKYNQFIKDKRIGVLNHRDTTMRELAFIKDIFLFIEESLIEGDDFLFKEYIDEKNKKFELKLDIIQAIQNLISNSDTEKAINLMIEVFKETESETLDNLFMLKSRYKENERNKMLGLEFDEKMTNKVNYGILQIIKEYKDSSQQST